MSSAFGVEHSISKADGDRKRRVMLPTVGSLAAAGGAAYADHRTNVAGTRAHEGLGHVGTLGRQANELEHQARAGHDVSANMSEVHTLARRVENDHIGALKGVARNGKIAGHLEGGSAVLGGIALANHAHNKRRKKTPVAKAYQPGLITYHQTEANRQGRKKKTARNVAIGSGAVGAAGLAAHKFPNEISAQLHAGNEAKDVIRRARTSHLLERHGKTAAIVGGIGAAAAGVKWAHHAGQQDKHEKTAQGHRMARNAVLAERNEDRRHEAMSKSAFGVDEEIIKGAVAATISPIFGGSASAPKGRKVRTAARTKAGAVGGTVAGGAAGSIAAAALKHGEKGRALGLVGGAVAGRVAGAAAGYRTSDAAREARWQDKKREKARWKRDASDVAKSAFGVEHESIEKFAFGELLEGGRDALRGVKAGLGGEVGPAKSAAGMQGKTLGLKTRSAGLKLKPMVDTPKRAAAVAGGGALTGGYMLGTKNS